MVENKNKKVPDQPSRYEPCEECGTWAGKFAIMIPEHHPSCSKYDITGDAGRIIDRLIEGIERWGAEEDGIYCWAAYRDALLMRGRPLPAGIGYDGERIE